jgi:DNA-binding HxlR family transcriptional regulator
MTTPDQPRKLSPGCSSVKTTLDVMGGKWKPLIVFLLAEKIHIKEHQLYVDVVKDICSEKINLDKYPAEVN